ncbi:MAG TPA: glycosyltransferase family 2 protein [Pirellulales bacterium]|nr:glycosyltransferase family 2 protein [Pirellulales bacterium]
MNRVALSIVIPVYNAAATLPRTLSSLACIDRAHRPVVEIVAVDDGSTDDSGQVIDRAAAGLDGFRWQRLKQPNGGLSRARNAALGVARGEWIFFLDADDELVCDLVPIIERYARHSAIGFAIEYRRPDGRRWRRVGPRLTTAENWLDVLSSENPYQPSSLVFRREHVDHLFDEDVDVVNDWLFWVRNHRMFGNMQALPEQVVAHIHMHANNMSTQYERAGLNRSLVAERAAALYADQLTRKQKNNLFLQNQIGRLQQRRRITPSAFLCLPCDPLLYSKFWVYALSSLCGFKATPYQPLFRKLG